MIIYIDRCMIREFIQEQYLKYPTMLKLEMCVCECVWNVDDVYECECVSVVVCVCVCV